MAERLRPGDHLCGHSYGAVVSLFAAEVARDLRSLTVIEPPAFGLATDDPQVAAYAERQKEYWAAGPQEPRAFLRGAGHNVQNADGFNAGLLRFLQRSARDEGVGASPP